MIFTVQNKSFSLFFLTEQRKHYTKTSINSLTDTSQYHVEVGAHAWSSCLAFYQTKRVQI